MNPDLEKKRQKESKKETLYSILSQLFGNSLIGLFFKTKEVSKKLELGDRLNQFTKENKREPTLDEIRAIEYEIIAENEAYSLFKKAVKLEVKSEFDQALKIYKDITEKYPNSNIAPEAESCIRAIQNRES